MQAAKRGPRSIRRVAQLGACILLTASAAPRAAAQVARADTVAGRVIAADSTPIARALVRLGTEDGREQAVETDSIGRYRFIVPGGSDTYALSASAFGYLPFSAVLVREPGATSFGRDLRLSPRVIALDALKVEAPKPPRTDQATAGENVARWNSFTSEKLVSNPGDFAEVAALEAGVASSGAGLSIAGQGPEQNGATVDGATYGGGSLPSEGVRGVAVVSNSYDVSRGQFSGGQIAATTIAGTNLWGGSLSTHLDDPALRYGGPPGGLLGRQGRLMRLGSGGGGPLLRDRLFIYSALDLMRSSRETSGLELVDAASLRRLSIAPDSAQRLLEIATRLGARSASALPAGSSESGFASALARLDYTLSKHQSLTLRVDGRGSQTTGLGSSPYRLLGRGDEMRSRNGGFLLQHTSGWGQWANDLRLYATSGYSGAEPGLMVPAAQVRVLSTLPDGTEAASVLSFGGSSSAPREEHSLGELSSDLRIALTGSHLIKAGFLLQEERVSSGRAAFHPGIFTFNSLADLEQGRAASFTRSLNPAPGEAARRYGALYLGDRWIPRSGMSLVYGLRLEGSRYDGRSALAPAVASLLDLSNSAPRPELLLTPRFGFRYDLPGRGRWTVEGGAGGFAGVPGLSSLAARWNETGAGTMSLACIGPAAPTPEWGRYDADPGAIPERCADGSSLFSSTVPRATVFAPDFGAPRTWRASLGLGGGLTRRLGIHTSALLVHGTHLPSARDLNLRPSAAFLLPGEDGRPVYVAPEAIDPTTGGISPGASRVSPVLGPVVELGSRGESWTGQFTAGVNGPVGRSYLMGLSYTHTRSRMLQGGISAPGVAASSTAGDPQRLEWAESPYAPRHQFQAFLSGRLARRLSVTATGRIQSGVPYTPLVRGDVNGDGFGNDRAFLFDPATTTDPALAAAMRRLWAEAPAPAQRCLRAGAGQIARAGACRTGWTPSLDLRAELMALGNVNTRRLALTLLASNVTAGVDYLLHGADDLHGWGQYPYPDATLLEVRGFDADRRTFRYDVNPNFGRPISGGVLRMPFRLTLQGRVTVGADPRYQPLMQSIEMGMAGSRESARAEVARRIRNLPAAVLGLNATDTAALSLTLMQHARLRMLADSLAPLLSDAIDGIATALTEKGPLTTVRRARLQEHTQRAGVLDDIARERTRELLTPAQWARIPAWLTRPVQPAELEKPPTVHGTISGSGM